VPNSSLTEIKPYTQHSAKLIAVLVVLLAAVLNSSYSHAQGSRSDRGAIYSFTNPSFRKIELSFTQQMRDALVSGVPLNLELDFVYITPRLFVDNHSLFERHAYEIKRHALSNRYMVLHNHETRPQLFATLIGLTDHLGSESLRLFAQYSRLHEAQVTTEASVPHLRLALDKYKLPGPVRLGAFVSNQWEFDTGWITWDFEN
jgi:hypothetical protein